MWYLRLKDFERTALASWVLFFVTFMGIGVNPQLRGLWVLAITAIAISWGVVFLMDMKGSIQTQKKEWEEDVKKYKDSLPILMSSDDILRNSIGAILCTKREREIRLTVLHEKMLQSKGNTIH